MINERRIGSCADFAHDILSASGSTCAERVQITRFIKEENAVMGYICKVHCPVCEYNQLFLLGCGRKDCDLDHIYSHLGMMDEWAVKVAVLEKGGRLPVFQYKLGRCPDCGRLKAVPEVVFDDGMSVHGKVCGCDMKKEHAMELYSEDEFEMIKCPDCGGTPVISKDGLWD